MPKVSISKPNIINSTPGQNMEALEKLYQKVRNLHV